MYSNRLFPNCLHQVFSKDNLADQPYDPNSKLDSNPRETFSQQDPKMPINNHKNSRPSIHGDGNISILDVQDSNIHIDQNKKYIHHLESNNVKRNQRNYVLLLFLTLCLISYLTYHNSEYKFYQDVVERGEYRDYEDYLLKYPQGKYVLQARDSMTNNYWVMLSDQWLLDGYPIQFRKNRQEVFSNDFYKNNWELIKEDDSSYIINIYDKTSHRGIAKSFKIIQMNDDTLKLQNGETLIRKKR